MSQRDTEGKRDTGKRESLLPCAPRARGPRSQLGALCLGATSPCPDVSCPALEECLVRGWHGALLAVRVTQIPILALACSGSTSCSFGLCIWSRSRLFSLQDGGQGREVFLWCRPSPLSPSRHRGGRGRKESHSVAIAEFLYNVSNCLAWSGLVQGVPSRTPGIQDG